MSRPSLNQLPASDAAPGRTFGSSRLGNGQRLKSTMATLSLAPIGEKGMIDNPQQLQTSSSKWASFRGTTDMSGTSKAGALNAGFSRMNLQTRKTFDPSNAPNLSAIERPWRPSPSQATTRATGATNVEQAAWIRTPNCVRSPYNRRTFRKGQIVSLPFHVPNTNDAVNESDPALTRTSKGPVYSKRRMAVVLWKYKTDMFCLPLFSFGNRGITSKPVYLRDEYMEIINDGEGKGYITEGSYDVLEATMIHALTKTGVVHITGGMRVSYQDDVVSLGVLTEDSRERLTQVWNKLNKAAQDEK